jgi:hypothetical protein
MFVVSKWRQGFVEEFEQFAAHEKCVLWYSLLLKCFSKDTRILIVILKNQSKTFLWFRFRTAA